MTGRLGRVRWGLRMRHLVMGSMEYKSDWIRNRSDVFLTGMNLQRGTLIPVLLKCSIAAPLCGKKKVIFIKNRNKRMRKERKDLLLSQAGCSLRHF